ncbi:MAG: lipopolysaccharide biosynthesis protein [Muribaculaceae bacterium]|nr:lipopolysaccharide biosynthesis protein [Muribaculaceae bacterium]
MGEDNLKQKAASGLLWGGIGSGGMQLLNLLFGIVLSRILTPADYGMIGALTVFSAVAGIFSESGFTLAIVNKKTVSDEDYSSVFWFNLVIGGALYTAMFFLAVPIARFYGQPEMVSLARFLFLSFFIGATATAPSAYLFRNLQNKRRSTIWLISVAISGITGVCCALGGMEYWGIAIQTVTYSTCVATLTWCSVKWRPKFSFSMEAIRELLPFSVKQIAVSIFTHFNNNFFAVLLGRFYGMTTTGYYTQGNKWTTMGYSTLSGMINSVGQPVIRQTVDEPQRLLRVFRKLMRFTAFLSFPAMFGLAIIANELIVISVTDKWLAAASIMQILCIGGAFLPLATLFGNLFNSIGRPSIYMWNTIALGCTQLIAMVISYRYGLDIMLICYTAINIIWIFAWQRFAARHAGLRLIDMLSDILPYVVAAGSVMTITWFVTAGVSNIYWALALKIVIAAGLYCLVMWGSGSVIFREAIQFIAKRLRR